MNRTIVEQVPRTQGRLRVVQSTIDQERSFFLESGNSFQMEHRQIGKYPLEAVQATQGLSETSGVCHGLAAVAALEDYLRITPTAPATQIRQIMFKLAALRAHVIHFYYVLLPDYINHEHLRPLEVRRQFNRFDVQPRKKRDGDLSGKTGNSILQNLGRASGAIAVLQQSLTLLGGKFPGVMNLVPGGISNFWLTRPLIMQLIRNLEQIKPFIETVWPEDVKQFIQDLPDTVTVPVKGVNLVSFGSLLARKRQGVDVIYTDGVFINGKLGPVNDLLITESLNHTFYVPVSNKRDARGVDYDFDRKGARTWIKGARYDGEPMLTGALARMMITHFAGSNMEISDRVARMLEDLGLSSDSPNCAASRLLAEVFEARIYIKAAMKLLLDLQIDRPLNRRIPFDFSEKGSGIGKVEAPGGSLLHQVYIDNNRISQYRIVSATNWNFSTIDSNGKSGIVETELNALAERKELTATQIHRIIHSYNPQIIDGTQ